MSTTRYDKAITGTFYCMQGKGVDLQGASCSLAGDRTHPPDKRRTARAQQLCEGNSLSRPCSQMPPALTAAHIAHHYLPSQRNTPSPGSSTVPSRRLRHVKNTQIIRRLPTLTRIPGSKQQMPIAALFTLTTSLQFYFHQRHFKIKPQVLCVVVTLYQARRRSVARARQTPDV